VPSCAAHGFALSKSFTLIAGRQPVRAKGYTVFSVFFGAFRFVPMVKYFSIAFGFRTVSRARKPNTPPLEKSGEVSGAGLGVAKTRESKS
jgi:hypothetical protein